VVVESISVIVSVPPLVGIGPFHWSVSGDDEA
jgi:hypothetical protein